MCSAWGRRSSGCFFTSWYVPSTVLSNFKLFVFCCGICIYYNSVYFFEYFAAPQSEEQRFSNTNLKPSALFQSDSVESVQREVPLFNTNWTVSDIDYWCIVPYIENSDGLESFERLIDMLESNTMVKMLYELALSFKRCVEAEDCIFMDYFNLLECYKTNQSGELLASSFAMGDSEYRIAASRAMRFFTSLYQIGSFSLPLQDFVKFIRPKETDRKGAFAGWNERFHDKQIIRDLEQQYNNNKVSDTGQQTMQVMLTAGDKELESKYLVGVLQYYFQEYFKQNFVLMPLCL